MRRRKGLGQGSLEKDAAQVRVLSLLAGSVAASTVDHGTLLGLSDDDHPQYLRVDGGHTLTGNLSVAAGVTIDGVDISEFKVAYDAHILNASAHHAPVTAGDGIGVVGQQVAVDSTVVRTTRTLTAGNGLTGGGTLAADRTFAVGAGDGITVAADTVAVDSTVVRTTLVLTAGDGLTGGGTLAANRTFNVGAGDGITVAADTVALTTPGTLSVSSTNAAAGSHTHAITASSAPGTAVSLLKTATGGGLTLDNFSVTNDAGVGGTLTTAYLAVTGNVSSNLVPTLTDTYDLGSSSKLWRKGWLSELESILFVENTVQVIGGWFMVPHAAGTLQEDVDGSQTDIDFGISLTVNDFVLLRGNLSVEYMQVTVEVTPGSVYTVTRDVDGTGANTWPQGQVFVVLGYTGDGRIEFDAQTAGPQIRISEQGATYNAQTERVRLGEMDGWKAAVTGYGIGIGDPTTTYLYYTPADGLVIAADGSGVTNIDGGNIQTGTVTATQLTADAIDGMTITGATIRTAASGARIEMNSTHIFGTDGTTTQWEALSATGELTAAAGGVVLNENGITIVDSRLLRMEADSVFIAEFGPSQNTNVRLLASGGISAELITDENIRTGADWNDDAADYLITSGTSYAGRDCGQFIWNNGLLTSGTVWTDWFTLPTGAFGVVAGYWVAYSSDGYRLPPIQFNDGGSTTATPTGKALTTTGTWGYFEVVAPVPSGATQVRFYQSLNGITPWTTEIFYLSGVTIRPLLDSFSLISLENDSDLVLQAGGNVVVKSVGDVELRPDGQVSLYSDLVSYYNGILLVNNGLSGYPTAPDATSLTIWGGDVDIAHGGISIGVSSYLSTPNDGDIWVGADGRFAGGLYVGSVATDPAAGEIYAASDIRVAGGLYVGSVATNPGTGDIYATADVRIGSGLAVGYTGAAPATGEVDIYNGTTLMGAFSTSDTTWFRINQSVAKNIYTPQSIVAGGGFSTYSGSVPGSGSILYVGDLISRKSSVNYTGYIYVPLADALVVYNGSSLTTGGYTIDFTSYSVPASAKALSLRLTITSATAGAYAYLWDTTSVNMAAPYCSVQVAGGLDSDSAVTALANSGPALRLVVGGATCTVYLMVLGYFI